MTTLHCPAVTPADQENVYSLADPLVNVHSTARGARAAHIVGSAKEPGKRSRGPRNSDAEKIELLLSFVDRTETAFALTDNVKQYLSSIGNSGNSNSTPTSLGLVIEALKLVTSTDIQQLNGTRTAINNAKAKQNATQSHNKLTKDNR